MSPAKTRRRKLRRARKAWNRWLARVDFLDYVATTLRLTPAGRAEQAAALDKLDRAAAVWRLVAA